MPLVIETAGEFARRHGACVRVGNRILFASGATASLDYETRAEPPADPLRYRRAYHLAKLKSLESNFIRLKSAITGHAPMFRWDEQVLGPDPGGDGLQALQRLRDLVMEQRSALAEVEAAIANLPAEIERRAAEERQQRAVAEARERDARLHVQIEAVTI